MNRRIVKRGRVLAVAALLIMFAASRAHATPLGLMVDTPDITAFFLDFTFDSTGNVCGGTDYTLCFAADQSGLSSYGLTPEVTGFAPYLLAAAIDPLTGLLTAAGGTYAIDDYLIGNVAAFGYELAGGVAIFEFLVDITGGTLASSFAPTIGVIGTVWDWGFVDFGSSLTTVTEAGTYTDNFDPIPEPASIGLLGLGLLTLAARLSRRRTA